MVFLLRLIAWLSASASLLVLISIGVGRKSDAHSVTGNMEIESQIYIVYIEDLTHKLRVTLEGTRCFEALPDWVYPQRAEPLLPPVPDYGRFFAERINNIMDILSRCRP